MEKKERKKMGTSNILTKETYNTLKLLIKIGQMDKNVW